MASMSHIQGLNLVMGHPRAKLMNRGSRGPCQTLGPL